MSPGIRVHLPLEVRRRAGWREVSIEAPEPATLRTVIRRLASEVDPCFLELLEQSEGGAGGRGAGSRPWMRHVLLNDRWLELPRDLEVELHDGDRVYFIQPVAGGARAQPRRGSRTA